MWISAREQPLWDVLLHVLRGTELPNRLGRTTLRYHTLLFHLDCRARRGSSTGDRHIADGRCADLAMWWRPCAQVKTISANAVRPMDRFHMTSWKFIPASTDENERL